MQTERKVMGCEAERSTGSKSWEDGNKIWISSWIMKMDSVLGKHGFTDLTTFEAAASFGGDSKF